MVLLGLMVLIATGVVYGGVRAMVAVERQQGDTSRSVLREWVEQEAALAAERAAALDADPAAAPAGGRWLWARRAVRLAR